jgi:hypothetical protein
MKVTAFLTKDHLQFNLEPESEHEKEFLALLKNFEGPATIHKGVELYECQGGYIRNYGPQSSDNLLAITITRTISKKGAL